MTFSRVFARASKFSMLIKLLSPRIQMSCVAQKALLLFVLDFGFINGLGVVRENGHEAIHSRRT